MNAGHHHDDVDDDEPAEPDETRAGGLTLRNMLIDAVLWAILASWHLFSPLLEGVWMPPWARVAILAVWCGLLGSALGGVRGHFVKGAIIGTLIGPIVVFALFLLAFVGG
jgi:hypothetical protein